MASNDDEGDWIPVYIPNKKDKKPKKTKKGKGGPPSEDPLEGGNGVDGNPDGGGNGGGGGGEKSDMWINDNKKKKKTPKKTPGGDGDKKKGGLFRRKKEQKKKKRWTFLQKIGGEFLQIPAGMFVSTVHGSLIVADKGANQIRLMSLEGKLVGQFGGKGESIGHLNGPIGICVEDKEGMMVVTEYWNNRVQLFSPEGRPLRTFTWTKEDGEGSVIKKRKENEEKEKEKDKSPIRTLNGGGRGGGGGRGSGGVGPVSGGPMGSAIFGSGGYRVTGDGMTMRCPWGVCFGTEGHIFVADGPNHAIRVFSQEGECLQVFGGEGSARGQLFFPRDIVFDTHRNVLVVADNGNHRIQMMDPETGECRGICGIRRGDGPGELNYPSSVAVAPDGNYIIADQDNHRLDLYSPDGEFIEFFGSWGTKTNQFEKPIHITCDQETGFVYVVEEGKPYIKVFQY